MEETAGVGASPPLVFPVRFDSAFVLDCSRDSDKSAWIYVRTSMSSSFWDPPVPMPQWHNKTPPNWKKILTKSWAHDLGSCNGQRPSTVACSLPAPWREVNPRNLVYLATNKRSTRTHQQMNCTHTFVRRTEFTNAKCKQKAICIWIASCVFHSQFGHWPISALPSD